MPRNIINTAMGVANACRCENRPRLPSRNTSVGTVSPARIGTTAWKIVTNCASSVVCAVRSLTPGFARPRTMRPPAAGSASQFRPLEAGVTSVAFASVTMTAGVSEGSVLPAPVKPLGLTPMIVTGTSLILIDRPIAAGDRANSRFQKASLIIATAGLPGMSSDGRISRPICALTPSTS